MALRTPEVFVEVTGTVAIIKHLFFFFFGVFAYTFSDILNAIYSNS